MLKRLVRPAHAAGLAAVMLVGAVGTARAAAGTTSPGMAPVGAAPGLPEGARVTGLEPASATLHVTVALQSADPAGLGHLATEVSTPGTAQFRRFLRPGQVQRRFGASPAAVAAVGSWLRSQHLATSPALADGLLLPITGTTAQVEAAFRTTIERVRLADGRIARVNKQAPKMPTGLRRWVSAVVGLDNLNLEHPNLARGPGPGPQACRAARTTRHVYTAARLANAYKFNPLYRRGDFGQHVTVALFELADFANKDIQAYGRCYRISPSVRRVRVDGGTTIAADVEGTAESTSDIEVVAVMAPRANILVYEAPPSGGRASELDDYGAIVQQDRAQVVSTSWGSCEPASGGRLLIIESEIFHEMALQGQSMMAAAGDNGSEDCLPSSGKVPPGPAFYSLQVDNPGSQPFVTAVGGTSITRYGSPPVQSAWNQTPGGQGFPAPFNGRDGHPGTSPGNVVGGGGISHLWWMPPWQIGFDRSGNSSGAPCHAPRGRDCREVPDVSTLAAIGTTGVRGYVIYGTTGGFDIKGWQTIGGTSLATPLWAALTALADQQLATRRLGLLSPSLYSIDRADPRAFTDVVTGNNDYLSRDGRYSHHTCRYDGKRRQPCYRATRGYDMATGLGTPQAVYLVADLVTGTQNLRG